MQIDISHNRSATKWSKRELVGRALWEYLGAPLMAITPRPFWALRRALLRAFGAKIGSGVHLFPSVRIAVPWNLTIGNFASVGDRANLYSLGSIVVGDRTTISQGAHLCAGTHNYRSRGFELLKCPIVIGGDAWICADAFIGPGSIIGDRAIVGARSVVVHDVEPETIVAGNPAHFLKKRPPID